MNNYWTDRTNNKDNHKISKERTLMFKDQKKLTDIIVDTLNEYDIKVKSNYEDKEHYTIKCQDAIIMCYKEGTVVKISFHVDTRPDDSAAMILVLNSIDEIKEVSLMEVHLHTNDNKLLLSGDEAMKTYKKNIKREIISEFVLEQKEIKLLSSCESLEC